MAKQQPNTPASETPFQRFERLAKKLAAVPKREVDKVKERRERDTSRSRPRR